MTVRIIPGRRVWIQALDEHGKPVGPRTPITTAGGIVTHPGAPRDVDLDAWRNGMGFHPANTITKQLGHESTRRIVGVLGEYMHNVLPAGRDKAMVFTLLEDVLMRANRALAVGGGPREDISEDDLRQGLAHLDQLGVGLVPEDPRIKLYKAAQLDEPAGERPASVPPAHKMGPDAVTHRHAGENWHTHTADTYATHRPVADEVFPDPAP